VTRRRPAQEPAWVPCPAGCGDFFCTIHYQHVHDCPCPPVEDWPTDPYAAPPAPAPKKNRREAN
jgi:hypothetical protein